MKWSDVKEVAVNIDKKSFILEYLEWGSRLNKAFESSKELDKKFKNIVVVGMGGSGIVGDILKDYINLIGKDIGIYVYKGNEPPIKLLRKSLLIGISHSGNTIETIKLILKTYKKAKDIAIVTGGGKLKKLAEENNWICNIIEPALAPRAGLPQLLGATLKIVNRQLHLDRKMKKVARKLNILGSRLSLENKDNEAFLFAKDIWGRIPIIYGEERYRSILHRIKSSFNENSKINSYYVIFPEGYHNEVEVYEEPPKEFIPIILRDSRDEFQYLTRYFETHNIEYISFNMMGKDHLERMLTTIMFFDLVSIYLAYLRGIDPYEINAINEIKRMRLNE